MPLLNLWISFITLFFIILVGVSIYVQICNRHTERKLKKFISLVHPLNPDVVSNIKLRYWTTNGSKHTGSINSTCDIYLFDNCLAINRREHFIYNILFDTIIITSDVISAERKYYKLKIYSPDSIVFKKIVQGEIIIKITDPKYAHYKIEITLMGMTKEQVAKLKRIENWLI